MAHASSRRPRFDVTATGKGTTGRSGSALLAEVADTLGLTAALCEEVNRCRSWSDPAGQGGARPDGDAGRRGDSQSLHTPRSTPATLGGRPRRRVPAAALPAAACHLSLTRLRWTSLNCSSVLILSVVQHLRSIATEPGSSGDSPIGGPRRPFWMRSLLHAKRRRPSRISRSHKVRRPTRPRSTAVTAKVACPPRQSPGYGGAPTVAYPRNRAEQGPKGCYGA